MNHWERLDENHVLYVIDENTTVPLFVNKYVFAFFWDTLDTKRVLKQMATYCEMHREEFQHFCDHFESFEEETDEGY